MSCVLCLVMAGSRYSGKAVGCVLCSSSSALLEAFHLWRLCPCPAGVRDLQQVGATLEDRGLQHRQSFLQALAGSCHDVAESNSSCTSEEERIRVSHRLV